VRLGFGAAMPPGTAPGKEASRGNSAGDRVALAEGWTAVFAR